jgi:Ca-activated chloride channel family protein
MTEWFADLAWREPRWLWLALFPWALLLIRQLGLRGVTGDIADRRLLPWVIARHRALFRQQQFWRHVLLMMAWLLFALALSGPRLPRTVFDQNQEHYGELMVVVDLSRSMTADDVSPSRLQRAKLELYDLVERTRQLRVGVVVFAARPHLLSPPTSDKNLLRFYLQQLRYGLLPTEGSDLRSALAFTIRQFSPRRSTRAVLLVTDGETSRVDAAYEQSLENLATQLKQQGIQLFALGTGTTKGAALLDHDGSWLYHQNRPVVSRLRHKRLKHLTTIGNGRFSRIEDNDSDWRVLYDQGIARLQVAGALARGQGLVSWQELYPWFLFPASVLWLLAYWRPNIKVRQVIPITASLLLGFALLSPVANSEAASGNWHKRAYDAYAQQSYQQAKQWYGRVRGYAGRMGEGSSAYRLGQYPEAVKQFIRATLEADSDVQRADALFNLANSYFKQEQYQEAADTYRDVLHYRPADANARLNLEYAIALARKKEKQPGTGVRQPGSGAGTASLPEGSDIGDSSVTYEAQADTGKTPLPLVTDTTSGPIPDLVSHGIQRAELAAKKIEESEDPTWTYDVTTPEAVGLVAGPSSVDESILWQRILEYEEEFPVLVETPHLLPGILPW